MSALEAVIIRPPGGFSIDEQEPEKFFFAPLPTQNTIGNPSNVRDRDLIIYSVCIQPPQTQR